MAAAEAEEAKTLNDELERAIWLADRVRKSGEEAQSSMPECLEMARKVDKISQMLRSIVRLANSRPADSFYDRPILRIVTDVSKNLQRARTLARNCKNAGFLCHVFTITTLADFKKVLNLLDTSIADLNWLSSIFDGEGPKLALPPFVSNDPTLAWVWSYTASLVMGRELNDRIDSANNLALLAKVNDRNKKMIAEEGAIPWLLKLLKYAGGSAEGQIAAANALSSLVDNEERTRLIAGEHAIPIIVQILGDSHMKVQIAVADLVARMANVDGMAREAFGRENVIKPLVSCLLVDSVLDDHNLIERDGSRSGGPEVNYNLKANFALALWRLCEGSLSNSRKIAEGKGLISLSKIIETEKGVLQFNCLMTVMEIAAMAETNTDLRKAAWKPNSPPVKAVLDQLLRVIMEESIPDFRIPAIKAIGSLSLTFARKETRMIGPLAAQLGSCFLNVAIESAIALGKFACKENYNRVENSKAIIEYNGVPVLMKMIRGVNEIAKIHGLVLLCHLSVNVGNSMALEEARALSTLEDAARFVAGQNPELRGLLDAAIHRLTLYQAVAHPHRHS
ncbi:hypothetical protein Nepgr_003088 [Nepenthes gracilis]|uniref:DUF7792 domain-containing protein n=1 Tax=Nepenthes gracilis TaxID=150966 RepID=A0AAD3RYZ1_NEPGR|nr:hypothetical protein Nepgr_003088 [Nepenthes gracilis]